MKTLLHLKSTKSTQDFVKEHLEEFDLDKLCYVFADHQTAGYGTRNRKWISSDRKSLQATYFSKQKNNNTSYINLAQVSSLSILKVLQNLGVQAQLKWSNDIYISHKKCGGSLCELVSNPNCYLIGIGLNINQDIHECKTIDIPATSLLAESGKTFKIPAILNALLHQLNQDITIYETQGFAPFLETYKRNMPYFGCNVLVDDKLVGKSFDISPNGAMIVKDADHNLKEIYSGSLDVQSRNY